MTTRILDSPATMAPDALLEQAFITEYLQGRGYRLEDVAELPHAQARLLLAEASRYASARLAEVEARAHFVEDIDEHRKQP